MLDIPLPSFVDVACPAEAPPANLCIRVQFTAEVSELITLNQTDDTIYEGFVGDVENQISCVLIDRGDNSILVSIFITDFVNLI